MLNEAQNAGFKLHNILIWKKNNKTPNRWYMKNCEFILFFRKGKSFPINNMGSSQCIECDNISGKNKLHQTQKPIELLEYLIKTYTNESDLVLDSTMGSGSTCVAAKNLNRKYIGIELDEEYFEIAKERINN